MGVAIGGIILMSINIVALLMVSDADMQLQMEEIIEMGVSSFEGMSVQQFRTVMVFSVGLGTIFIVLASFAIGLAGGYVGGNLGKGK